MARFGGHALRDLARGVVGAAVGIRSDVDPTPADVEAAPPPLETDLSFLCTLDDDAIYRSLADLPPSQVTRLLLLIAEVAQDVTYAMGNLGQLDVEVPVAHMSQTGPPPNRGRYPQTTRGDLAPLPSGPRFPDQQAADAIHAGLDQADGTRPDPNPAPPNPTDGAGAESGGLRVLPGFAPPRIDPNEPLVHSDPNRPGCTPVFVDRGQLTPRRANTGPWTISEGWERLSIFLPETPGPFIRTDSWPWPDLFCFEEQDLPSWAPLQDPPSVLSHLQIRGYCSHDCPANIELETIEDSPVPVHPPVAPAGNPALASDLGSLLHGFPLQPTAAAPLVTPPRPQRLDFLGDASPRPCDSPASAPGPSAPPHSSPSSASSTSFQVVPVPTAHPVGPPLPGLASLLELGDRCTLFLHTKLVPVPRELQARAIAKNAPSTLQLYLRSWSAWVRRCILSGIDPADPPPGALPSWLQLTSAPSGLSTTSFKALSWMAKVAGLPSIQVQLHTPLCSAFLSSTGPVEKREALPFSVSFVVWLAVLLRGSVLCLIWSSLRWNDGLWSPPFRVILQSGSTALTGVATRTKSCRANMPWGCQLYGLTGSPSACWGMSWLNALQQCVSDTKRIFPDRRVDFLLPVLGPDPASPVFVSPLHRSRAMPWLRALLQEHWHLHSSEACPPEHSMYGVHSCKATVLSWARQLNLDPELRRLQGHHRPSSMEGSVRVYSRDDIGPMLSLQAEVINRIRSGYRPLQPVGRGSSKPLPDFRVSLPPPDSNMGGMAPRERSGRSRSPRRRPEPAEDEVESTDLSDDSSDSEQSGASGSDDDFAKPRPPRSQQREPSMNGFLHNPRSNVLHRPVPCPPDTAKSVRVSLLGLEPFWVKPACGASVGQLCSEACSASAAPARLDAPPRRKDAASACASSCQFHAHVVTLACTVFPAAVFCFSRPCPPLVPPSSAMASDGYPSAGPGDRPVRAAWDRDGAVLLPSAPELQDLEDLTDQQLLDLLRRCSVGFLARLVRLCGSILRPPRVVIYCQLPCVNPECPQTCGRQPGVVCSSDMSSSGTPAFDDPAALVALLRQWSAPDELLEVLTVKGFKTIATIAYAIPPDGSPDDWIRVLWPPADPNDTLARITPAASFARRLLVQARDLVHPAPAPSTPASAGSAPPSLPGPKITAEAAELLRQKFIEAYPGEVLSPSSTPSLEFLNRLRSELDKPTTLWIPWRLRTSEHDVQTFYEHRRPRSDNQLLRSLLDDVPDPVVAHASVPTSGPVEPLLRRHFGILVTALAFLGDLHLRIGKTFAESFIASATAVPLDPSLRAPSLQEVLAADRSIWAAVGTLMRDEKWSLSDSIHEVSVTRHMIPILLLLCPPTFARGSPWHASPLPVCTPCQGDSSILGSGPPFHFPGRSSCPPGTVPGLVFRLGLDRIAPIDVLHGEEVDLLLPQHQSSMRKLCSSGLVRVAVAAPPCSSFSRARLKRGGPPAVRTPAHPHGIPAPSQRQQAELQRSDKLHELCRELLTLVLLSGGLVLLENPSSSLLWLTDPCKAWIRHHCLSAVEIAACSFGVNAKKSWTFISNLADLSSLASACCHPPGTHPPLAGKRDSSGAFLTRTTACYPDGLCERFAALMAPYLSRSVGLVPFLSWETALLEPQLCWPLPSSRIEDGAGSCSTASWSKPSGPDTFGSLRKLWVKRILSGDFLAKFRARLASGSKDAPISESELEPFLGDLRSFLGLAVTDFDTLLSVPPGQPFRLFLLDALLQLSRDPDRPFVDLLLEGVPLGVDEPMPACPTLFPASATKDPSMDLQHCSSSWGSALSDLSTVDSLLQTEVSEGWVREVPGGLDSLVATYARTAVGKLGLVKAPDRDPRLVVDSSVSGVTEHTTLPNKSANPTISGLRRCFPLRLALEQLFALILDVSKAHRRILIRAADQGLLCFFHRGRLFQCLTLNFGARASGFYWARLAGILSRLMHRLLFIRHALLIYVDDLISLLSGPSAPVWAAVLCVFLLVLRVPMSWHKAYLGARPTWIGWSMSLETFTATLEPPKLARLRLLISSARSGDAIPLHLLRKLTGKLLWVCSLFRPFRHRFIGTRAYLHLFMLLWPPLRGNPSGCTLVSVASRPVHTLKDVPLHFAGERRLWISVRSPPDSDRKLSQESKAVLDLWHSCLCQTIPLFPLSLSPLLTCEAFADACADSKHAGLGGFVAFPSGRTVWFRSALSPADLARLCAWYSPDTSPQKFIAAWELLGQIALLWCVALVVPAAHHPVHFVSRCDNSPSESASWKGLSTARGMCDLLHSYLLWQRHFCISAHIDHVPGFRNKIADALSRSRDPGTLGLNPADEILVPWHLLCGPPRPSYSPAAAFNRDLFPALDF
ncbi:LRRC45 [Symbiodinium sp. CCMP2592]|nr:LRRC45 [Symbiodinium sp. CCMP2592]